MDGGRFSGREVELVLRVLRKRRVYYPDPKYPEPKVSELCPICGHVLEKNYKYCPYCGEKLKRKEVADEN